MDQEAWMVVAGVALVMLVLGFLLGRIFGGAKSRVVELEMELARQQTELSDYKQEVEAHFDKTASLFVSMAGSYKDLFDHLSSGSERISAGPARKRFRERVDALLIGEAAERMQLADGAAVAAAGAAGAVTAAAMDDTDDNAGTAEAASAEPAEARPVAAAAPSAADVEAPTEVSTDAEETATATDASVADTTTPDDDKKPA
ncbi:MAG: DUF1043 family protein [Proteobacteria bacterium]|nr:MAG: DUF1043 family protein [Pseudomonadota bacterium]